MEICIQFVLSLLQLAIHPPTTYSFFSTINDEIMFQYFVIFEQNEINHSYYNNVSPNKYIIMIHDSTSSEKLVFLYFFHLFFGNISS